MSCDNIYTNNRPIGLSYYNLTNKPIGLSELNSIVVSSVSATVLSATNYNLSSLNDVSITNPSANQVLVFYSSTNIWQNASIGPGGSPITLNEIVGVAIAGETIADIFYFNGTQWVNTSFSSAASSYATISYVSSTFITEALAAATYLTQDQAVAEYLTQAAAAATYMPYTFSSNFASSTHSHALSSLSDVDDSISPVTGESLVWDGAYWVASSVGGGAGVTDHGALTGLSDNDHPQYVLSSTNSALSSLVSSIQASTINLSAYINANEGSWGGVTDHGALSGLSDNDHPQYVLSSTNSALSSLVSSIQASTINLSAYINANEGSWGGGASTFLELTDTPGSYVGQGGKFVMVGFEEGSLVFIESGDSIFLGDFANVDDTAGVSGIPPSIDNNYLFVFDLTTSSWVPKSPVDWWATEAISLDHNLLGNRYANSAHPQYASSSVSSLIQDHISSSVHWDLTFLSDNFINASGDSSNNSFYLNNLSATVVSATTVSAGTLHLGGSDGRLINNNGSIIISSVGGSVFVYNLSSNSFSGVDHGSILGLSDNDHPQYVLSSTNSALSSLVGTKLDYKLLLENIGNLEGSGLILVDSDTADAFIRVIGADDPDDIISRSIGDNRYVLSSTNNALSSLVSNIQTSTINLSAYINANEGSWGGGGATHLSGLNDVSAANPQGFQILIYNSSVNRWTNVPVPPTILTFHADGGANVTLTNQTNAEQFFGNSNRNIILYDLTNYTQVRLVTRVVTASTSVNNPRLYVESFSSFTTTVGNYTNIGDTIVSASIASTGIIVSPWINILPANKRDMYITILQNGGDGAADPALGPTSVQFR